MSTSTAIKSLDETRPASRSFIYRVSDAAVLMRGLDANIHPVSAIARSLQLPFASRYRTLSLKSRHEPEPGCGRRPAGHVPHGKEATPHES